MRNEKGQFLKGNYFGKNTEYKNGSKPANPIKKGERRGIKTEFKV